MSGRMKRQNLFLLFLSLSLTSLLFSAPAWAKKTIYKGKFDEIYIISAEKKIIGEEALEHPATIDEAKIYNMLATLRFSKNSVIFKDKEDVRLFDQRGLKFLSPYLTQALAEASPEEVVYFRYIKKDPKWKVLRNDRVIIGRCFVRNGELLIRFQKLYAKIFGDYQRVSQRNLIAEAKDVRVALYPRPGHRALSQKFIALQIDHDYRTDVEEERAAELAAKKKAKEEEEVRGVPLPDTEPGKIAEESPVTTESPKKAKKKEPKKAAKKTPVKDDPKKADVSTAGDDSDIVVRLKTLDELKKQKLISGKEYKKKKQEILEGL